MRLSRNVDQRAVHRRREFELHRGAAHRLLRGPRPIRGQRQQIRKIGQLTRPERQLRRHHRRRIVLVTEQRTLPQRVIGILHRQRLPIRRLTVHPSRIRHHHISSQRRHRRTVGSNVMHHDRQHELIDRNPIQPSAERNIHRHIETETRIGRDALEQRRRLHVHGHERHELRPRVVDRLTRSLAVRRERRAQRLVTHEDIGDGRVQGVDIHDACQSHRKRNVVRRRRRVELVDEPHPLLRLRQRNSIRTGHRNQRRPRVDRGESARPCRQHLDGRGLEQRAHADVRAERTVDSRRHTRRTQRIAAEVEEVVVESDVVDTQHLAEHLSDGDLGVGDRFATLSPAAQIRCGQRPAIELAGRGQWNGVEQHERRRNHVRRQRRGGLHTHVVDVDHGTRHRHQVRHEHGRTGGPRNAECGNEFHTGNRGDDRIDLAQLDAESANLDLEVGAADVFERAGIVPPHHVSGAVHPFARYTERCRDESFGCEYGAIVVPASQSWSGKVQLTRDSDRNRLQSRIEDDDRGPEDGASDLHRDTGVHLVAENSDDRRLGRSVGVEHLSARRPPLDQFGTARFTAGRDDSQLVQARRIHRRQRGRRDERMRHTVFRHERRQFRAAVHVGRRDDQRRSAAVGEQQLEHTGVEARGRERQHPRIGRDLEAPALLLGEVLQARVRHDDALRHTRRTGRVDEIRSVGRPESAGPVGVGDRGVGQRCERRPDLVVVEEYPVDCRRGVAQHGAMCRHGNAHADTGVGEHVRDPVHRIRRIHRQERSTGLRHRPHRHDRLDRPRQRQRHERTRTHTTRNQQTRQPRRRRIQLPVRHRPVTRHERRRVDARDIDRTAQNLRQQPLRDRQATPHRHQSRTLGLRQQIELAHQQVGCRGECMHHASDATDDGVDCRRCEQFRQILRLDVQAIVHHGHERHRILRGIAAVDDVRDAHPDDVGLGRQACAVHRVGLEHRQRIECDDGSDDALNLGQAEIVVIEQARLFVLQPRDEVSKAFSRIDRDADRQRVDEETDHGLDVVDFRWPARDRRAEEDVVAPRQRREDGSPCRLDQGVQGDTVDSRERPESFGVLRRQGGQLARGESRFLPAALDGGEQRRLGQPCQRGTPCVTGGLGVPATHPRQILAVRGHPRKHGVVAVGCVQRQQFSHQQRRRPAVDQNVVVGENQTPLRLGDRDEHEPQERCFGHVETPSAIGRQKAIEFGVAFVVGQRGQIDRRPRHVDASGDDLHRIALDVVHERSTQVRVPIEKLPCRRTEACLVDRPRQRHDQLHQVGIHGLVGQFGVEQQTCLQRGHRPDVDRSRIARLHVVDGSLVELDEVEIGRRESAGTRTTRVVRERRQRTHPQRTEAVDVVAFQHPGREGERCLQACLAVVGRRRDRVDVQGRGDGQFGILDVADLVAVHRQPTDVAQVFWDRRAVAAEIVEADLRRRVTGQGRGGLLVEVAKHAVSDSVIGYGEQPLLDGLDQSARIRASVQRVVDVDVRHRDSDREDRGEPADGPGQVRTGHDLILTAVALEADQRIGCLDAAISTPCGHRERERRHQPVVDAAVERFGDGRQQVVGDVGRKFDFDLVDRVVDVDRGVQRTRSDERILARQRVLPQVELASTIDADLDETVRPPAHRRSHRKKRRRLARNDLRPRSPHVGHQDSPRHTVDDEVMRDDQQPGFGGIQPDETNHRTGGRIEQVCRPIQFGCKRCRFHVRMVQNVRGGHRSHRLHVHGPRTVDLTEAAAQHVVVVDDRLDRSFERDAIDSSRQRQQRSLGVSVENRCAFDHPGDDRCERYVADASAGELLEDRDGLVRTGQGDFGERCNGLALEHVSRRQDDARSFRTRHELDRHDAVATEREERLVDAYMIETQHLCEQFGEMLLDGSARLT
ncbi:hypothetical protein RhoFasB10_03714 [Rhodococcus sp. B10]|nr:hypothetical protein [Rhodococcus sp. B10]